MKYTPGLPDKLPVKKTGRVTALPAGLRPDCDACCGLCCVAPAFDAAQGFGFDKPAHTPCKNLQADFRCAVHDRLAACGFPGCVVFDCHGAGQRVTQEMFQGAVWSESVHTAEKMFHAFTRLCDLHELMALLTIALQRVTEKDIQTMLETSLQEIEQRCQDEMASPGKIDIAGIKRQAMEILRGLESTSMASTLKAGAE